jgi:hypothetical protein
VSKRVTPSERLRAEVDEVFAGGADLATAIEQVARIGARLLLQTALEAILSLGSARNSPQARMSRLSLNFGGGPGCDQAAITGSLCRVALTISVAAWRWRA